MKLTVALISVSMAATVAAQTTAHPPAHKAGVPAIHAAANCAKLPDVSPKLPALPAGTNCAQVLYTLRVEPPVKIDYVAPAEGSALEETLGLTGETFSLLYVDTKAGTGALAAPKKWYSIRYTGYLPDGTVFDSNADKPGESPFAFQYGGHQVISGWDTGFAGMHVGGKRRLFIPYQLAYGANGRPPKIPPKSMLVFDLEFVAQSDSAPQAAEPSAPPAGSQQTTPPTSQRAPASSGAPGNTEPASTAPKSQ